MVFFLLTCLSFTQTLPDAPSASKKVADVSFWTLTGITVSANLADAITTTKMVGQRPTRVAMSLGLRFCMGTRPSDGRVITVMGAETVGAAVAAYYVKKHNVRIGRFKLWALPLTVSALGHGMGAATNMRRRR